MLGALGVVILALVLPLGIVANKVKNIASGDKQTQMADFTKSKNALTIQQEQS